MFSSQFHYLTLSPLFFSILVGVLVGSELRQPLGYTIVGGLALSQILTLYTTPVVYIYLDRLQTWMFRGKRTRAPPRIRLLCLLNEHDLQVRSRSQR